MSSPAAAEVKRRPVGRLSALLLAGEEFGDLVRDLRVGHLLPRGEADRVEDPGVAFVPKALRRARSRVEDAGVELRLLEGDVTDLAAAAVGSGFDLSWAYEYPDETTLGRAMMAPAGIATLVGPEREDEVRAAIVEGLEPYRTPEGGYRLENEFHFLIARV